MFDQTDWLANIKIVERLEEAEHRRLVLLARKAQRARRSATHKWTDRARFRVVCHVEPRDTTIQIFPRRHHAT